MAGACSPEESVCKRHSSAGWSVALPTLLPSYLRVHQVGGGVWRSENCSALQMQLAQEVELVEFDDFDGFPLFTSSHHSCCFLLAVLEAANIELYSRSPRRMPAAAAAAWDSFSSVALSQPRLNSGSSGGESRLGEKSSSISHADSDSGDSSVAPLLPSIMDIMLNRSVAEMDRGPRTTAVPLGRTALPPQASPAVASAARGPADVAAQNVSAADLPLLTGLTPAKITGVTGRSFPCGEEGRCLELAFTFLFSLLLCLQGTSSAHISASAAAGALPPGCFLRRAAEALGGAAASSPRDEDSVTGAPTSGEAAAFDEAARGAAPRWRRGAGPTRKDPEGETRTAALETGTAPLEVGGGTAAADAATALHDACEAALQLFPRNPFFLALHFRLPPPTAASCPSFVLYPQQLLRSRGNFTARHRSIHLLGHPAWGLRRSHWPQQKRLQSTAFLSSAPTASPEHSGMSSVTNVTTFPQGEQVRFAVSGSPHEGPPCRQEAPCSTAPWQPAGIPRPRRHRLSLVASAANAFADTHASASLCAAAAPGEKCSSVAAEGTFSIAALEACVLLEFFTGSPSYKHISRLMETALQSIRLSVYYEGWPAFMLAATAAGVETTANAAATTDAPEATPTLQNNSAIGTIFERAPLHDFGVAGCLKLGGETSVAAGSSWLRSKAKETIFNLHAHVCLLRLRAAAAAEECFAPSCGDVAETALAGGASAGCAGRSSGAGDQQQQQQQQQRHESSIPVGGVLGGEMRMSRSSRSSKICCGWARVQDNVREALRAAAWNRRREAQREADRVLIRGVTQFPYSKRLWLLRLQHLLLQRELSRKRSTRRETRLLTAARASFPSGLAEPRSSSGSNTAGLTGESKGAPVVGEEPTPPQRSEGNSSNSSPPSNLNDAISSNTNSGSRTTGSAGRWISRGSSTTKENSELAEGELQHSLTYISPADEQLLDCVEAMWDRGIHLHFDPVVTLL